MSRELLESLRQHQAEELTSTQLVRELIRHNTWHLPAGLMEGNPTPLIANAGGENWLSLFTDPDQIQAFTSKNPQSVEFTMEMRGLFVFSSLQDGLTGVNIDPESEHAIHYRSEQFEFLRSMADGMILDEVLAGTLELPDAFDRFKKFQHFQLPMRVVDGRQQLMLAPDNQGRKLAAVFTTKDAAGNFSDKVSEELSFTPEFQSMDGKSLFERLSMMTDLEGIVFNCKGPGSPRAVAIQFAQVVLQN